MIKQVGIKQSNHVFMLTWKTSVKGASSLCSPSSPDCMDMSAVILKFARCKPAHWTTLEPMSVLAKYINGWKLFRSDKRYLWSTPFACFDGGSTPCFPVCYLKPRTGLCCLENFAEGGIKQTFCHRTTSLNIEYPGRSIVVREAVYST